MAENNNMNEYINEINSLTMGLRIEPIEEESPIWTQTGYYQSQAPTPQPRQFLSSTLRDLPGRQISYWTANLDYFPERDNIECGVSARNLYTAYYGAGSSGDVFQSSGEELSRGWVEEFRGRIGVEAEDRSMCEFFQERVGTGCLEERQMIFSEVRDSLYTLAAHKVGSFLVRKLIAVINDDQVEQLLQALATNTRRLKNICSDVSGSKVIKTLVERVNGNTAHQTFLVGKLSEIAVVLTENPNCKQILMACLANYPCTVMEPFLSRVATLIKDIATNRNGCCALQSCFDFCLSGSSEQLNSNYLIFRRLVGSTIDNALYLSTDVYGNYVVQKVIGFETAMINRGLVRKLSGNFVRLSMDKYGSNVVEKLLKACEATEVEQIISQMIDTPQPLQLLMDGYANYVVQTAIKTAKAQKLEIYSDLLDLIQYHAKSLVDHVHGRNVYNLVFNNRKDLRRRGFH